MRCAHCAYSGLTEGPPSFFDPKNVPFLLQWYARWEDVGWIPRLHISGGEPTCHPQFWEILDQCVKFLDNHGLPKLWMATNGKRTLDAIRLASMARDGVIACGLSRDQWHEPIDQEAVAAFRRPAVRLDGDRRFIQNINWHGDGPIKGGRSLSGRLECPCSGKPFVTPDGKVHQCGCLGSGVVGDIWAGFRPLNDRWSCFNGLPNGNTHQTVTESIWGRKGYDGIKG